MKLLKDVIIKQILTEQKKTAMVNALLDEQKQFEQEIEQLKFQLHKSKRERVRKHELEKVSTRYKQEIDKREEKLRSVLFKLSQVRQLALGTELYEGKGQRIVEVHEGDRWTSTGQEAVIVIKDGIIDEIRESGNDHD